MPPRPRPSCSSWRARRGGCSSPAAPSSTPTAPPGIPEVLFLPQAMDPAYDRPATRAPSRYRCDLSFVGSGQYPDRHGLLRRLAGGGQAPGPGARMGGRRRPAGRRRAGVGQALRAGRGRRRHLDRRSRDRGAGAPGRLRLQPDLEGAGLRRLLSRRVAAGQRGVRARWACTAPGTAAPKKPWRWPSGIWRRRASARPSPPRAGTTRCAHHTYAHRLPLLLEGRGHTIV